MCRLCSGGNILDKIDQMEVYTEIEAATFSKKILSVIAYFHSKSIIHRDIKPSNILFNVNKLNDFGLKMIDFGCATVLENKILRKKCGTVPRAFLTSSRTTWRRRSGSGNTTKSAISGPLA